MSIKSVAAMKRGLGSSRRRAVVLAAGLALAPIAALSTGSTAGAGATPTTALPSLPPESNSNAAPTTQPAPPTPAPTAAPPTAAPTPAAPPTAAPTAAPTSGPATPTAGYSLVTDNTGLLSVEVPNDWPRVDTRPFINDSDRTLIPAVTATTAPSWSEFVDSHTYAGFSVEAYPSTTSVARVQDAITFEEQCTLGTQTPFSANDFVGTVVDWNYCAGGAARAFVVAVQPTSRDMTIVVVIKTLTPVDEGHASHVLATFRADTTVGLPTETVPPDTESPTTTSPPPTTVVAPPTVPAGTTPGSTAAPTPPPASTVALPPLPGSTVPGQPATTAGPTPVTSPPPASTVPATAPGTSAAPATTIAGGPTTVPAGMQAVADDTGILTINVPTSWTSVITTTVTDDDTGAELAAISATDDRSAFGDTRAVSGVLFAQWADFESDTSVGPRSLASAWGETCAAVGEVVPFTANNLTGHSVTLTDCEQSDVDTVVVFANAADGRQITIAAIIAVDNAEQQQFLPAILASLTLV